MHNYAALSLSLVLAAGTGIFLVLVRQLNIREKRARELEFQVLSGQINPHFMYNTLETIVWKAQHAHAPDIAKIASQLGALLRLSMSSDEVLHSVEEELRQVRLYSDLQKLRYKERLEFSVASCPEELLLLKIPRLILQPCVENAIIRGMRPRGQTLHITLEIERSRDDLLFRVRDDGTGIERARLEAIRRSIYAPSSASRKAKLAGEAASDENAHPGGGGPARRGIGLRNIHERIRLYCGKGYGLYIGSVHGEGTLVTLKVPAAGGGRGF